MLSFLWFVAFCVAFAMLFGLRGRMRLVELRVFGASPVPFEYRHVTATGAPFAAAVAAPPAAPRGGEPAYGAVWPPSDASAAGRTRETVFGVPANVAHPRETEAPFEPAPQSAAAYDAFLRARFGRPQPGVAQPDAPQPQPAATSFGVPQPAMPDAPESHGALEDGDAAPVRTGGASTEPPAGSDAPAGPQAAVAPASRVRRPIDWELFAGGRLLNVAGALALVVGVVLLMKYALDENWIGAQMRVVAGLVAGIGLLGGGHIARMRRAGSWFSQGIVGAGIGVLYASGYAAFDGYHLIPSLATYAFLCVVTFAAFALALKYDSIGLAVIGWAGGFATPFVTGDDTSNAVGLASYLLILDGGLLAISIVKRRWFVLAPLAIAGSYVTALAWYVENGARESVTVSAIALVSLWLVFFAAELFEALRDPKHDVVLRTVASIANAAVFYIFLCGVLAQAATALEAVTAIAALGYAVAYGVLVRRAPDVVTLRWTYVAAAALFGAFGCAERFSGETLAAVYAFAGLAIAALARLRRPADASLQALREVAVVSFGLLFAAYVCELVAGVLAGAAWNVPGATHDSALVALAISSFATERLLRHASLDGLFGFVSRQLGLATLVCLEAAHLHGFAFGNALALDALALAALDRGLRSRARLYGIALESTVLSGGFMLAAAAADAMTPGAFDRGTFGLDLAGRDVAGLVWIAVAFCLAALVRDGSQAAAVAGSVFRRGGIVAIAILEGLHVSGYALSTLYAGDAIAFALGDRLVRAFGRYSGVGSRYAPEGETFVSGVIFVGFAWSASAFAALLDPSSAVVGRHLAFGFGGVDLSLAALLGASLLYVKLAARGGFSGPVLLVLRQSAVATVFATIGAHLASYDACAALSLAAIGFSVAASRTRARDLRADGVVSLAVSLVALAVEPATWQAVSVANLLPLVNERFAAFALASIATFVASELYLGSNGAVPMLGRGGRVAAFLIAIVGATLEVRDAFAHALQTFPIGSATYVRLESLEQLSISGVWIAASLALVALGIRIRVRELRLVAIGLFDLTILKAFFVDLHSLDTPYRIASFFVLGVTLLAVSFVYQRLEKGYFGPPEPREETRVREDDAA